MSALKTTHSPFSPSVTSATPPLDPVEPVDGNLGKLDSIASVEGGTKAPDDEPATYSFGDNPIPKKRMPSDQAQLEEPWDWDWVRKSELENAERPEDLN